VWVTGPFREWVQPSLQVLSSVSRMVAIGRGTVSAPRTFPWRTVGRPQGIEVARRLREVCDAAIIFVTGYTDRLPSSASMNVYQERQYCPSRFIVTGSPTPYRRSHSISTDGRQGGATEAVIAEAGDAGGHH
jgi:hypothetical protein